MGRVMTAVKTEFHQPFGAPGGLYPQRGSPNPQHLANRRRAFHFGMGKLHSFQQQNPFRSGLITSTILTLEIVPAIYSLWRGRQVEWVKGPCPPRKKWDELSQQFVEWERQEHQH